MKKNKGFALIELMIVVAMIGILTAIAIPKVSELVWRSKNEERKRRGLDPLPAPSMAANKNPTNDCYGTVVSAFAKDNQIVKVYSNGCVEKQ